MKEILSFPICHHCTFFHFHVLYSFIATCSWLANTRYLYPIHDSFLPIPHFCNSTLRHSVHFYPIAHHISLLLLSAQVRSHSLFYFQSLYTLSCPFQRQIWFISQDCDASKGPELVNWCQVLSYCKALASPQPTWLAPVHGLPEPSPTPWGYPMLLTVHNSNNHHHTLGLMCLRSS